MNKLTALLLSCAGTITVASGASFSVTIGHTADRPKEPPSTTVVVHGETSLSVATTPTTITPVSNVSAQAVQPSNVLETRYKFNERSARVRKLQRELGVLADGHYGNQTRKAHIAKLKALGLSTEVAPSNKPTPRYNISYDASKRCPQFEADLAQHGLQPVEVFSYLAWRESRCNPASVNARWKNGKIVWTLNRDGTYDSGLLQINSTWTTITSQICGSAWGDMKALLDVNCNLKVAKYLLDNSADGLGNWRIRRTN
jgi:hypothetical protein